MKIAKRVALALAAVVVCVGGALLARSAPPQTAPAVPAIWNEVARPNFDGGKVADVKNLVLVRDRIRIELQQGKLQFARPAEGAVFAAAFRGTGQLQVEPPDARERQQLRLHANTDTLSMNFTDAVFSFTDKTFDEVAQQVKWEDRASDQTFARLYQDRFDFRENYGGELLPRLVKGLLSENKKETEFFLAEVKTREKDWVIATLDALNPEEILVGRWLKYGAGTTLDEWMSFPRGGRTSAQAWHDPIAREDVVIENYRIDATVTAGAELKANVVLQAKPKWSGERVLNFVLDSNLRVTSVKDSAGRELPFAQPQEQKDRLQAYGTYVSVFLPQALAADSPITLKFEYGGKRVIEKLGAGVYFCQSFGWYPARDNFAARSNFEMTFRSPKRYSLVATGAKQSEDAQGNETISIWKSEKPMAVAGFAYGEVKIEKTKAGNIDVEVYANRQPDEQMANIVRQVDASSGAALGTMSPALMAGQIATEMANSIKLFEKYFGPYPYTRLAISTIPYSYGQGWPTLIYLSALSFMDSFQRRQFGFDSRAEKEITRFFRAHETSHQWWGHKVAWKSYHDQWLSEGFAEFSGNLYLQYDSGWKEYHDRLKLAREGFRVKDDAGHSYDEVGPIWMGLRLSSSQSPGAYSRLVYEKGGFVLHMLRMMLYNMQDASGADATFMAMMREFTKTYDNKAASTEDFKAIAEKYMTSEMNLDGNRKLDWFFNQYVYGTGIPTYEFKYAVSDAGPNRWKLSGTVTQSGVPEGWKDVLPLYMDITHNNQKLTLKVGSMAITQRVTQFEEMLQIKPDRVVLCLNEDSIAIIKQ
ncbi:MAG TPA: M1 family aminopeptidase [Candidatus Nitrosotenuis sp.]|nr:M1 family aminopeptidase [Candidatus Nitrosotenuis sp.]